MRLISLAALVLLVFHVTAGSVLAQTDTFDLDSYIAGFDQGTDAVAFAGCNKKLDSNGEGSTCECTASGSGSSCRCTGSGSTKVCQCDDPDGTTYCYYCGGGTSSCECGPTNRSGQACRGVDVVASGDIYQLR